MEAPLHKNFYNNEDRRHFNSILQAVAKEFANISVLSLKKIWEPDNGNLFLQEGNRFTSQGLNTYWEAVDRTIQYAATTVIKKLMQKLQRLSDKYHWSSDKYHKN